MRSLISSLALPWLLVVMTINSLSQAMLNPCTVSNITVWIANRPVVTRYNCNSNVKIHVTDLRNPPDIQYIGLTNGSDRFTVMLLKSVPNSPELFDVHWFMANVTPDRDVFLTKNKMMVTEFIVYKKPTPGDFQVFAFKQNLSGPIPQGPGFTADHFFSLNKWMSNNARTVSEIVGGAKFQAVNATGNHTMTPSSPGFAPSLYPSVPVGPIGANQNPPPYNPHYQPPPYQQGGGGGFPQQYPHQQTAPGHVGAQNSTQVVHHYHHHETVKKKKNNSSPVSSFSLALLGISTLVVLL